MWEDTIRLWTRDDAHCEQVLLSGGKADVAESCFGANDFAVAALMDLGLWDTIVNMYPNRLKDENGYNWQVLNGIEILRCLLGERTISGANKVLSDSRLVAAAGFNLQDEKVSKKLAQKEPVMDAETLSNHLARIDEESCYWGFLDHIKHLRKRKWIRGKVFAADGKCITVPYGRSYDGMGKVKDAYGYKLEALLSVEEGRELFAGFAFGPLQRSEKPMLLEIFDRYEQQIGPIRKQIEILLLDRLYWGESFFKKLKERYHIDFVTRPRDRELDLVKQIFGLIEADENLPTEQRNFKWKWRTEKRPPNKKYPQGETRKLRIAGLDGMRIEDENGDQMDVNVVVVYEHDEQGQPIMDPEDETRQLISIYVTSLPAEENPLRIRKLYRKRWVIENQGFRTANQNWHIDSLASRVSMDAMRAHIAFCLMLYNSERIINMKFPGPWQEEMERLKKIGRDELTGGFGIIVYTGDGHLGIFDARRFREIIHAAGQTQIKAKIRTLLRGRPDAEEILNQLDSS